MINGTKISVHRFNATTLFRMIEGWPHSSGNNDWPLIYKHWQLKRKLRLLWDIKTSRQLLWDIKTKVNPKMYKRLRYFIKNSWVCVCQTWVCICQNTFGHSKTITNLLTSSGELLSNADLIATLTTNVTYAFLRSL